jgi:hypothetical protein
MKNIKLVGLLSFLLLVSGCRKEIIHEAGIIKLTDPIIAPPPGVTWTLVNNSPVNVMALESYKNKLYIGGSFSESRFVSIASYDGTKFSKVFTGSFIGDGVTDLQILGNKLWLGGRFTYLEINKDYDNLMYLDNTLYGGINFGDFLYSEIYGLSTFEGDLIIRGSFNNNKPNLKTKNIERLKGMTLTGFGVGIEDPINDFIDFNGKLYICGNYELAKDVYMFGYWNNNKWNRVGDIDRANLLDDGFAVAVYQGALYMAGDKSFKRTNNLQKFDGVAYTNIPGIEMKTCKMKEISGELYLFGEGILKDGVGTSNILKFNGQKWESVGKLNRPVFDVTLHDKKLYAATAVGIYVLE